MTDKRPIDPARPRFEAYLGHYQHFWSYLKSYHEAFNALVAHVRSTHTHVDTIAYPMLFIARHCLELGFKANIRYFKKYSKKDDPARADIHDLGRLFQTFTLHVLGTIESFENNHIEINKEEIATFRSYCAEVEKLVHLFNAIDNSSTSFRYPVDTRNKRAFQWDETINILDIKELFERTMVLLTNTSDVFKKYTDYADEIEAMYEDELKGMYC